VTLIFFKYIYQTLISGPRPNKIFKCYNNTTGWSLYKIRKNPIL